jgi:hypothetical protein
MIARLIVVGEEGIPRCRATRAASAPLLANPKVTKACRRRRVWRSRGDSQSGNCSAKMRREQDAYPHIKRRTRRSIVTRCPPEGTSAAVRT